MSGGDHLSPYFENLRLDLQFRLSEKPELIEKALPARADQLAQKFADAVELLFLTAEAGGPQTLLSTNQEQCVVSDDWIPSLRKTFLDALEITVKLRQRKTATEFLWLEAGAKFDDFWLQAENNGTKVEFEGKSVLLTLVPAAFGWIPDTDKPGEMEEVIYYKAAVVLDMDDGS
jgi:hypothetical protein